ncbi:MAG TPA: hypothetical protein VMV19_05940, partial [Xanthobacteraceae bacterium]|nr:hypothetical protein [Xanthobacteraceae bacterium]
HPGLEIHVAEQRSRSLVSPAQISLPKKEIESRANLTDELFLQQPASDQAKRESGMIALVTGESRR